jgi:hypothetical protein
MLAGLVGLGVAPSGSATSYGLADPLSPLEPVYLPGLEPETAPGPELAQTLGLDAALLAAPSQAEFASLVDCPNSESEFRTGNAQCVFTCGGSDTLWTEATSSQTLESITGKAECGGAAAACGANSNNHCKNSSNDLTTRAHNAGACKATGFDPWWAGSYTLTANCWSVWDQNPGGLCLAFITFCVDAVRLQATIIDGIVVDASGVNLTNGMTFVPMVETERTLDGLTVTIST